MASDKASPPGIAAGTRGLSQTDHMGTDDTHLLSPSPRGRETKGEGEPAVPQGNLFRAPHSALCTRIGQLRPVKPRQGIKKCGSSQIRP